MRSEIIYYQCERCHKKTEHLFDDREYKCVDCASILLNKYYSIKYGDDMEKQYESKLNSK